MDSYKDLIMKLGMQDKAKYKPCCLKGILVPKQLFVASQFAHFCQLQGQQQQIASLVAPLPGAMMLHVLSLLLNQGHCKFKHLLKLCRWPLDWLKKNYTTRKV